MELRDAIAQWGSLRAFDKRFLLDDQLLRLYNALARARERQLDPAVHALLRQNVALKGRHAGRSCYVIGNGPSLKDQDLTVLRDEITFVVNRFIHHPEAEAIDPTYYVIVDPKFGSGQWGSDFAEQIEKRLPNTTLILTPDGDAFCQRKNILQSHARYVVYPNQQYHFGYRRPIDLTRGIPGMSNVTKVAVSSAVYMGVKHIQLLGIDGNGLILPSGSHFYGHESAPEDQVILEKALVSMSMGLRGYRAIASYLDSIGVKLESQNPRSVMTALPFRPFVGQREPSGDD